MVLKNFLSSIAYAIRGKNKAKDKINAQNFSEEIKGINKKYSQNVINNIMNGSIDEITFPEDIELIGPYSFYNCKNLTKVNLSNTKIKTIGEKAFQFCENIEAIKLPNSLELIEYDCFDGCTNIINVELEEEFNCNNLNLSSIKSENFTKYKIVKILNALKDRTDSNQYTLILGGNNIKKLSNDEKIIATSKNWLLK